MVNEHYRVRYEGVAFEHLMKQYFAGSRYKFMVDRTFFESIGAFKAIYLFYSIRCVFSKKRDDLLVSITYSSVLSRFLNYFFYACIIFVFLTSTFIKTPLFVNLAWLSLILLSLFIPTIDAALGKRLYRTEGSNLYAYISRYITDSRKIDADEYDALIKDRYCYKEYNGK